MRAVAAGDGDRCDGFEGGIRACSGTEEEGRLDGARAADSGPEYRH